MIKIKKFDNLFLGANNLEEAKAFYSDVLGLDIKFDFSQNGLIAFKVGSEEPAIILKDISKFPSTKPTIWFEVESVKEIYEELKVKEINFLSNPFRIRTGWAVEFLDPSGNKLGLTDYKNE